MPSAKDTTIPPSPEVPGDTTPATPAGQEQPDYKAELVKELLAPEAEAPTPPTPTEPEAEKPTKPEAATEEAAEAETPAPTTETSEEPEAPEASDEDDLVGPADDAPHGQKVAWGKLKAKLKQATEEGQFGQILAKVGASAGITPEDMAGWVGIRARMAGGDPTAIDDLKKMVGIKEPAPPKPSVPDVTEKVYKDLFEDVVRSSDMTEEAARGKAKVIAERMISQMPDPEPVRTQPQQRTVSADPVSSAASQELDRLDTEMAAKVPKWAELRKEVFSTIATKHNGAPAIRWVPIFNEVVREVQLKYTKPATQQKVKPTESLKPGTSASASSASSNYKAELVRDMLAGKV